ncbi:DUF4186 family protein [Priestia megaterium]|uniref:DUF4186 family protein n=1 Tax=Priestia megaterium TaxID=1404 RepID=UPI00363D45EE
MSGWSDNWNDDNDWMKEEEQKPLRVKCTDADCESDLHCFLSTKEMIDEGTKGSCRYCGVDLVNWERVHTKDINDIEYLFKSLKYELIRHHLWHVDIDQRAINYGRRKGKIKLKEAVINRLNRHLKGLPNNWDGRQTPFEGNIIFYAQHATATCCRKCVAYWYGIPSDRELTSHEVQYFTDLIMKYVDERMPNLTVGGEKVPPIRKKA